MNQYNTTEMLREGTILHGNYRIEGHLASGGFGNTYKVTHTELEETFAIKEFYIKGVSERGEDSTMVKVSNTLNRNLFENQRSKFKKEALRLRKLHDQHIVGVYDLFDENGTSYYVMDFIEGISLSMHLKQTGKPMPEEQLWGILPQIMQALETVHTSGFQHLDLKPANIMMDGKGNITLIDFGASKQLDTGDGCSTSSALAFTPGYAPREQMEQNLSKLGPWTDLYALGATLYNLLTCKLPPLPSDIDDEHELAFSFPEHISEKMKSLILWMMTPKRAKRPQSVAEVRNFLNSPQPIEEDEETTVIGTIKTEPEPKAAPEPIPDPRPNPTPKHKPGSKHRFFYIAAAVIIGLVLSIILWSSVNSSPMSPEDKLLGGMEEMVNVMKNTHIKSAEDAKALKVKLEGIRKEVEEDEDIQATIKKMKDMSEEGVSKHYEKFDRLIYEGQVEADRLNEEAKALGIDFNL